MLQRVTSILFNLIDAPLIDTRDYLIIVGKNVTA